VPSAAILYCFIITVALALAAVWLGDTVGLTFMFMTIAVGAVLTGMVLNNHRDQLKKAIDAQELIQDKDIIGLLLNDFEDGTSDWLWECDANETLTYISPRLVEAVGKPPSELMNMTLQDAFNANLSSGGWSHLRKTMAERSPITACGLEVVVGEKTLHWQLSARPLFGNGGVFKGYRGVGRDVTAEWETDHRLILAKETAEAASAAKSQFLAVMSHELRTPLNSIVGFSEILSTRGEEAIDGDARLDYARTILESSKHLQNLINDILDATRIENGSISIIEQDIDPAELTEIVVKMCRDQAEKADVTIVAKLTDGIELRADTTRTRQVILNLLTNAIKFSPPGGFINVELVQAPDNKLVFLVRDGGIGIRSTDLTRIFEPFVQAEEGMARRFSGIGLGLSIARKIARLHGGDVTIESQFGTGTTARFELPAARVKWPKPNPGLATVAA
jgi:signal transduction histidine kinase